MTTILKEKKSIAQISNLNAFLFKFRSKLKHLDSGCVEWTGSKNWDGYGQINFNGITISAHRAAYEIEYGAIPTELDLKDCWVLHKCDNRSCCNPEHLYLGNAKLNAIDCANRKRMTVGWRSIGKREQKVGTVFYKFKGEIKTLKEWSRLFGVNESTLDQRFLAGWPEKDIPMSSKQYKRHTKSELTTSYKRFSGVEEVETFLKNEKVESLGGQTTRDSFCPIRLRKIDMATVANNQLTFQSVNLNVVDQGGQAWITSTDIAKALGYSSQKSVATIFNRNKDEFSESMSLVINLMTNGINGSKRNMKVRIFSLRGAHLLAMFANTALSKAFRKWVLDILDKEVADKPAESVSGQTSTLDRTPLRDAVNMLVAKRSLNYPEAYGMVHQRFGIKSFEELTKDQLPAAIEYVHRLCIEGELLPKQPAVTGLTVTLPAGERFGRYLVVIDDGKASLVDANNKALIDIQVARQLANEAGAVAAYIESKAEQRDLEAKLLREESRRLRIFMGEESKSRLEKPLAEIFSV